MRNALWRGHSSASRPSASGVGTKLMVISCETSQSRSTSAELLRDWLVSQEITISFVPTPLAEGLLALEWPRHSALRILLTGGDTLRRYPPANLPFVLINNYGPTECTVVATSGPVLLGTRPD